jgi:formate hydrogenlyase transcriptional activator
MGDQATILVVDGDPRILALTSAILASDGYEVIEASSGKDALEAVANAVPDLVLLDVVLPDVSGYEVCKQIKSGPVTRNTFVVLQSGVSTSSEAQITGLDIGADGYVVKGISNSELLARVKALVVRIRKADDALQHAHDELDERVKARTAELLGANQRLVASEKALLGRLKFETLLAELSARFVNLPADWIDSEIEDAQRRICEFLDVDRSTLWQVPEGEPGVLLLTHVHQPPEILTPPARMNAGDFFPWTVQKVLGGETVTVSKMTELPPEAGCDRGNYRTYGTKSGVYVPLSIGEGPVFGLLTFAVTRKERSWPETIVMGFKLIAQVFANALQRKQAEQALRESETKLSMATDAAGAGLWVMEPYTGHVWVTPKTRELLHFAPDKEMNYESFFKAVHPEDRDRVEQAVQEVLRLEENLYCDYRIALPDGSIRWMIARGRWHPKQAREPVCVMGVLIDITERKLAEQAQEERLQFETLLAEISGQFVNLPADQIDAEIEDAMRRVCEHLNLDLSAVWQAPMQEQDCVKLTHLYGREAAPLTPEPMDAREHFPWIWRQIRAGKIVKLSSLEELPEEAALDRESCRQFGVKSNLTIPLSVGGQQPIGVLGLNTTRAERTWPDALVKRLQTVSQVFANALERKRMDGQLREHIREIEELRERLERENIYLKEEVRLLVEHTDIVGQSVAMKKVLTQAEQVAQTDSTVLLLGETGTGKELLARAIHSMSLRKDRPLITVNCASLPPTLIESELFGREKGAYTGALTRMIGRFEIADGSTLFLDEIGELPLDLQSKLLRVLEDGTFERLGSTKPLYVNVRIIAATNRDIGQELKEGKFRRDLFYRLNVFPIVIPPLRKRPEDIPLLVRTFVKEFQKRMGKEIESIPKKTMQALQSYSWPGNVRELRNVIEHAMILSKSKTLDVHVPERASSETDATGNLEDMERMHMVAVLEKTGWRIDGQGGAAQVLGLKRTTLQSKMKKLSIKRSNKQMPN